MSQGQTSVAWAFDLTARGTLVGNITPPPGASVDFHHIYFQGALGTATEGIRGEKNIPAGSSNYSLDVPPGQYDVALRTYYLPAPQHSETKPYRVTIPPSVTTTLNFAESLGTAQAPVLVTGFLSNADVTRGQLWLEREDPLAPRVATAVDESLVNGRFDFALPYGLWRKVSISLSFGAESGSPSLVAQEPYLDAQVYHLYKRSNAPVLTVPANTTLSYGTELLSLVKTTLYFDVKEAQPTDPEILLSTRPPCCLAPTMRAASRAGMSTPPRMGPGPARASRR
ncbi:hypothetical protein NVS55_28705 [Myxococcus stipitatus]|uniref:hypothetical protein n=1 Tax=Myxococcus stipitatus TaxID=83455 RepID=UPI003144EBB4